MTLLSMWLQHTVTVEPYLGSGAFGDTYGAPVTVSCWVEASRKVVRDADGSEVVSGTTVYAQPGVTAPARSRVTLPDGRVTLVITVADRDSGALPLPSHTEITCE